MGDEKPESGRTNRRSIIVGSAAAVAGAGIGAGAAKVTEADLDTSTVAGSFTTPLDDAKHPLGVQLSVDNENGTALPLCDPQGRPRIQLRVVMDGTPSIAMLDENGVVKQL